MKKPSSSIKAMMIVAILALFSCVPLSALSAAPLPSFPMNMQYDVLLQMKDGSPQGNATFTGRHYFNADQSLSQARVDWMINWNRNDGSPTMFFSLVWVMEGGSQVLYTLTTADDGTAQCAKSTYKKNVFDINWAKNATYDGVRVFDGKLVHAYNNTVPFFIQGTQEVSTFYMDFYTHLPVAFESHDSTLYYKNIVSTAVVSSIYFDAVSTSFVGGCSEEDEGEKVMY